MKEIILNKKNIVIVSHKNPDGDAIGSSLALQNYLFKLGKEPVIILPDIFPNFYSWMKGSEDIVIADKLKEKANKLIASADLIFCLDFNDLGRVGEIGEEINSSNAYKVMIDHHQDPADFSDHIISDTTSCSTAQLIYQFIQNNGDLDLIDNSISEGIYTGIITDSGSFKYSNVQSITHLIAADLIKKGLDHSKIHENIFDQNELSRLQLLGYALNKIEILPDAPVAFIAISLKELKKFNISKGATEGLVNYCLSIKDINVAAFLREDKEIIRMSFRSKGNIKVNEYASRNFDGGGHHNAAGGKSSLDFKSTVAKFKESITQFLS